jgi:hypothetical protein
MSEVVLINPFEVPDGKHDVFLGVRRRAVLRRA